LPSIGTTATRKISKCKSTPCPFCEPAGSLIVEVEFIVTADHRQRLGDAIEREQVRVF